MLKLLLKKQMSEIFRNYFYNAKKNCARSKGETIGFIILYVVIMVGLLGGMFSFLSLAMCASLVEADMGWLYFALLGMLSILLGVFGSVFSTYSALYLSKDNDLMLSLPIPVNLLMVSRLLTVYLMGLMYCLVVIVPAVVVYWIVAGLSAAVVLGSLLFIFLISIFVLTLSCALGWVVAKLSLKLKNKSLITVVISLACFGGYYFVYFKAQVMLRELLANAVLYGEMIKGNVYPLYLFGGVGVGNPLAMLVITAVVLALFALVWVVISRSFLKIATSSGAAAKRVYKEKAMKQNSVFGALLAKEFSRFLSSPMYMLNCGLGVLLLPIGGILLLWKSSMVISVLNEIFGDRVGCTPLLFCTLVCLLAAMNDMAAPSISLEGKNLWLVQSLPVSPWQVLKAKIGMHLILTGIPVLFCIVCLGIVYPYTVSEMLLTILVLLSYVCFSAFFGLFLGLKIPNLNWTNEITPIKQSASATVALFSGFGYGILLCLGFMLLGGWKLGFAGYLAVVAAITLVLCVTLFCWLRKKGCRILVSL